MANQIPPSIPQSTTQQPSQIYTMPAKYIPPRKIQKPHSVLPWVLIGFATLVVVILGVIVVVLYVQGQETDTQQQGLTNGNVNTTNVIQNANIQNTNAASNRNTGAVLNLNIDPDLNRNIQNGLFNGNQNTNSNANTGQTTGGVPGLSTVKDSRDKDKDGLTDVEEELYGTKFQLPDSDKDGYVDGTEIMGLFSPIEANKTALQSGLVLEYSNDTYGWSILYPKKWIAAPLGNNQAEILFTSDAQVGEFVEVIVTENTKGQSAAEWYADQYKQIDPNSLKAVNIGGLQGVVGKDGYVYYLANDEYLFTLVYKFGTQKEVHYSTTFEMMVKSFSYTPVQTLDTNANINGSNTNNAS